MADLDQMGRFRSMLRKELPHLSEQYGVATLGLFGSTVRGDARSDSDLDLLVKFKETPGLLKLIELENYLSDLLGIRVDLVMADALKANIGARILAEVVPL